MDQHPAAQPRPKWITAVGWVTVAAIAALVVIACIGAIAKGPDTSNDQEYSAIQACQEFVEKRLKAPTTAEFNDETATADGDVWTVTGAVDSQNSFGAMIRSNYRCIIRDAGSQWVLTSLTGLN